MSLNNIGNCEGYLIWDYERGEVICSSTGEVIDRIYDYSLGPSYKFFEEEQKLQVKRQSSNKNISHRRRYYRKLSIYNKALSMLKNKPWLNIDYDKLFKQGRFVETIISINTQKAISNVEKLGLRKILEDLVIIIQEIDPAAAARTWRTRMALAYIIYVKYILRKQINEKDVISIFMISPTTLRRLEKIARRIIKKMPQKVLIKSIVY